MIVSGVGRFAKAYVERLFCSFKKTYRFQTRAELFGEGCFCFVFFFSWWSEAKDPSFPGSPLSHTQALLFAENNASSSFQDAAPIKK